MKKTNIRGILEITVILFIILSLTLLFIPNTCVEENSNNQTTELNNNFLNNNQNNNDQGLIQELKEHTELFCENLCGNGVCDEHVLLDVGSTCYETIETCPIDCE